MLKIHAIYPDYEGKGHEKDRKYGEYPNGFVGALSRYIEVDIEQVIGVFVHSIVEALLLDVEVSYVAGVGIGGAMWVYTVYNVV